MAENDTSIIKCKKCGILTRHEWVHWERRPSLLLLFTGRIKVIDGWECTKCGHRQAVSVRYELSEQ